jgi:hypothetical protein
MIYLTPATTGHALMERVAIGGARLVHIVPGEEIAGARRDLEIELGKAVWPPASGSFKKIIASRCAGRRSRPPSDNISGRVEEIVVRLELLADGVALALDGLAELGLDAITWRSWRRVAATRGSWAIELGGSRSSGA